MNELFQADASSQQLRFNGDRAAFVRGNLQEFISLLNSGHSQSGKVVWPAAVQCGTIYRNHRIASRITATKPNLSARFGSNIGLNSECKKFF
jgi:hypothetical protein